jgi:hypothetical protein
MEPGISSHVWSLSEIVALLDKPVSIAARGKDYALRIPMVDLRGVLYRLRDRLLALWRG